MFLNHMDDINYINIIVNISIIFKFKFIQIHMFIADIKVHIPYTIKIFKLTCYNDFTI